MKKKGYSYEIIDVAKDFIPTIRKRMIIDDEAIDIYLIAIRRWKTNQVILIEVESAIVMVLNQSM